MIYKRPEFPGLAVVVKGGVQSWAVFSHCEKYRYALARIWNADAPVLFGVFQNPSKATHTEIDPTLAKFCHYARRDHFGGVILGNAFGYRATDPKDLDRAYRAGVDVIGMENMEVLHLLIDNPAVTKAVGGWGRARWSWMRPQLAAMRSMGMRQAWHCWGITQDGNPKHPLYLRKDAPMGEFRPSRTGQEMSG